MSEGENPEDKEWYTWREESAAYESILRPEDDADSIIPKPQSDFSYTALENGQIRLFYLHSCLSNQTYDDSRFLTGWIVHVPRNDTPPYAGLSYAWGDPDKTHEIIVNGKMFKVGQSLFEALVHLQEEEHALTLWIDAICINQEDEIEKSSQVNGMGAVFEEAAMVLAWLGPSADDSRHALRTLLNLGQTMLSHAGPRGEDSTLHQFLGGAIDKMASEVTLGDHAGADVPITTLTRLLRRPWWRRLWVLQETALAKKTLFICGYDELPSISMLQGYLALLLLSRQPPTTLAMSTKAAMRFRTTFPVAPTIMLTACHGGGIVRSKPLVELLCGNFALMASNPSDYIFGMLGLAGDTESLKIQADYTKPVEDVYVDTMTALLLSGELSVLSLIRHPRLIDDMPTWVADLTNVRHDGCNMIVQPPRSGLATRFSAGIGSLPERISITRDGTVQILSVAGVSVGVITDVDSWPIPDDDDDVVEGFSSYFESFEAFAFSKPTAYDSDSSPSDVIWRLPIGNVQFGSFLETRDPAGKPTPALFGSYEILRGLKTAPVDEPNPQDWRMRNSMPYVQTVTERVSDKMFFISSNGYLGYGNSNLRQGDQIVLLHGAQVPHVIRSAENGRYSFVSEAYVHGIMYGEFLSEHLESKVFELV